MVTASVGHMPSTSRKVGFSRNRPFFTILVRFMTDLPSYIISAAKAAAVLTASVIPGGDGGAGDCADLAFAGLLVLGDGQRGGFSRELAAESFAGGLCASPGVSLLSPTSSPAIRPCASIPTVSSMTPPYPDPVIDTTQPIVSPSFTA